MYKLMLNEEGISELFYPLTMTRSFIDLRAGIFSIREKWERMAHLQGMELLWVSSINENEEHSRSIPANFIPPSTLDLRSFFNDNASLDELGFKKVEHTWELINLNSWLIEHDLKLIDHQKNGPGNATIKGSHPIIVGSDAILEDCIINASEGPVIIDHGAHIMDGAILRGPVYVGSKTVIKMGAMIYGGTVIGSHCVVGGEVKNSTLQGYSNKAHHGYLGNSFIGEWCNLGAGTSCSNLKNTGGQIKSWDIVGKRYINAGTKAGIVMGDHVKTAIHTGFNSGTVIGPFSNVFEFEGLTNKFIEPFSWGGRSNAKYDINKLIAEIERWMQMKNIDLSPLNEENIRTLYNKTN